MSNFNNLLRILSDFFTKKRPYIVYGVLVILLFALIWLFIGSLPDVRPLKKSRYNMTLIIRDWKGKKAPFILGPRNPYWTPLSQIPPALKWAVVLAEDDTFYQHSGFNMSAMKDALWEDIKRLSPVRGGSTITQQLAKNLYLSKRKSLPRKFKEAVIAWKLERHLSKGRILELYLNVIEWGPGVYGIGEGSWYYFHKSPNELGFYESVLLAAIIPSPKMYNPFRYPHRALGRYKKVLSLMYTAKLITIDQYELALSVELTQDPLDHFLSIVPTWQVEEDI